MRYGCCARNHSFPSLDVPSTGALYRQLPGDSRIILLGRGDVLGLTEDCRTLADTVLMGLSTALGAEARNTGPWTDEVARSSEPSP
jgi:hypothetical protein